MIGGGLYLLAMAALHASGAKGRGLSMSDLDVGVRYQVDPPILATPPAYRSRGKARRRGQSPGTQKRRQWKAQKRGGLR